MNDRIKPHVQQFEEGFGDIDPAAAGEAAAAAAAVHARYEGLISEVSENRAMSPEQRAAAISGLRYRQQQEAKAESDSIMAAAANNAAGRRETMRLARIRPAAEQDAPRPGDTAQPGASRTDSRSGAALGAIRAQFRAAFKEATCRADDPQPMPRRRRGETDKGYVPSPRMMRSGAVARGRYAALQHVDAPDAYASAGTYLADTLEWLNLWDENADNSHWPEEEFSARQECYSFQL